MNPINKLITVVLSLFPVFVSAQVVNKDIYKAEIGLVGGGSYYLGDANSTLFNDIQPAYGGYFRYVLNPRIAFRAELIIEKITSQSFSNELTSGDICAEYNFFDLEKNPYKRFSKSYSPYIFTGIGFMSGVYSSQILPEISIPFGVGMKLKLSKRWNLDFKWSNKLLLADNMEGLSKKNQYPLQPGEIRDLFNNPNKLNGTNFFNNDLLSTLTIGISYDIWKKKCDCLNSTFD